VRFTFVRNHRIWPIVLWSRITTYINNLHPQKEKVVYDLISRLIDASIPLWNLTLAPVAQEFQFGQRIYFDMTYPSYDKFNIPKSEAPQQAQGEDEEDFLDRRCEWIDKHKKLILPDVERPFKPLGEPKKLSLREQFGKHGLQVIVKLANIELTPENPKYHGGVWHVEGQMVSVTFDAGSFIITHLIMTKP